MKATVIKDEDGHLVGVVLNQGTSGEFTERVTKAIQAHKCANVSCPLLLANDYVGKEQGVDITIWEEGETPVEGWRERFRLEGTSLDDGEVFREEALTTGYILWADLLGGTVFQTFDKAYELAQQFVQKFPVSSQWGIGEDNPEWDEEVEKFVDETFDGILPYWAKKQTRAYFISIDHPEYQKYLEKDEEDREEISDKTWIDWATNYGDNGDAMTLSEFQSAFNNETRVSSIGHFVRFINASK